MPVSLDELASLIPPSVASSTLPTHIIPFIPTGNKKDYEKADTQTRTNTAAALVEIHKHPQQELKCAGPLGFFQNVP
jgi:hypothetical protein